MMMKCDFCSSPDVRWAYPARDFRDERDVLVIGVRDNAPVEVQSAHLDFGSRGGWNACPACHALIGRGDRERLARRSAKRAMRANPGLKLSLRNLTDEIRHLHDLFWSNRQGAPEPVTPTQEIPT